MHLLNARLVNCGSTLPDTSVIRVNEVAIGTVVRVLVPSAPFTPFNRNSGLFRVLEGGDRTPLNQREWRKVLGTSRRKFIARVITNNTVRQELTLSLEDPRTTNNRKIRYEVILPYSEILRLARLVPLARAFDTVEDEQKFRRAHRASPINKAFFDPKDQFIGVQLVVLVGGSMVVNFTFQVGITGGSETVPLPADVFDDGDYTVTYAYNTVLSGGSPTLLIPDTFRTKDDFVINAASGTFDAGTTIDFHAQAR